MYVPSDKKKIAGFVCAAAASAGVDPEPIGTCWIAMWRNSRQQRFAYVVTAKHVVEALANAGSETAYLRLPGGIDPATKAIGYVPVTLNPKEWLFHDDETVDVAVLPFRPLQMAGKFHFDPLFLDELSTVRHQVETIGGHWPPAEGEDVVFIALMKAFPGKQANTPVVRRGSVSLITDEKLGGEYGPSDYHVIQAQSYPGNSGSPVFVAVGRMLVPWGVLAYGFHNPEDLRQVKGVENSYYNLGLTLVVPIQKVIDIIDSEGQRAIREERGLHAP